MVVDAFSDDGIVHVEKGDSLSKISKKLGISLDQIKTKCIPINITPPYTIYSGMTIDCSSLFKKEVIQTSVVPPKKSVITTSRAEESKAINALMSKNNTTLNEIKEKIKISNLSSQLDDIKNNQTSSIEIMKKSFSGLLYNTEYEPKPTKLSILVGILMSSLSGILASLFMLRYEKKDNSNNVMSGFNNPYNIKYGKEGKWKDDYE